MASHESLMLRRRAERVIVSDCTIVPVKFAVGGPYLIVQRPLR